MLIVTEEALTLFLRDNAGKYPYCDVLQTRRNFHASYLFMKRSTRGVIWGTGPFDWVALSSSMFDTETVQHLIVSKQALPVPPDMGAVLDCMEYWGRRIDPNWYDLVVQWMALMCYCGTQGGSAVPKERIMMQCIEPRIERMLHYCLGGILPFVECRILLDEWRVFFEHDYNYGAGHFKDFFYLANRSFDYIGSVINRERSVVGAAA